MREYKDPRQGVVFRQGQKWYHLPRQEYHTLVDAAARDEREKQYAKDFILREHARDEKSRATAAEKREKESRRQAQSEQHEREVMRIVLRYVEAARRQLIMLGSFNEADVLPNAYALAERSLHHKQLPRQGDQAPRALPAPIYRPSLRQVAQAIFTGKVKQPPGSKSLSLQQAALARQALAAIRAGSGGRVSGD